MTVDKGESKSHAVDDKDGLCMMLLVTITTLELVACLHLTSLDLASVNLARYLDVEDIVDQFVD